MHESHYISVPLNWVSYSVLYNIKEIIPSSLMAKIWKITNVKLSTDH